MISCPALFNSVVRISDLGPKIIDPSRYESRFTSAVDVSALKSMGPSEDLLFSDGLGDRLLVRDAHGRPTHECLSIRPELTSVPAFEFALNERLWLVEKFDHPSFLTVRNMIRLPGRLRGFLKSGSL